MKTGWRERHRARTTTAEKALECVRHGTRVFVGSGCAEPTRLVGALARRDDVADVEVLHIMTVGHAPYADAAQRVLRCVAGRLAAREGAYCIVIAHDLALVRRYADSVVAFREGRVADRISRAEDSQATEPWPRGAVLTGGGIPQ
jgi:hypothetical protein